MELYYFVVLVLTKTYLQTERHSDAQTDGRTGTVITIYHPQATKQKENKSFEEYKANIFNLLPRYIFSV